MASLTDLADLLTAAGHRVTQAGSVDANLPACVVTYDGLRNTPGGMRIQARVLVVAASLDDMGRDIDQTVLTATQAVAEDLLDMPGWMVRSAGGLETLSGPEWGISGVVGSAIHIDEAG